MPHRIAAALVCAALVAGCNARSFSSIPQAQPDGANAFVLAAPPVPVKGSPIQHVIVLIQENRTMDNMFNGFPGADTVTKGHNHRGKVVQLQPQGLEWPYDPSHSHGSLVKEYDNGKMDGFDLDGCDLNPLAQGPCTGFNGAPKNFTYSYVPQSETLFLQILSGLLTGIGYGLADHMFSSRQVPSFPGHQYLIAGNTPAANDPKGPSESGLTGIWGCDAPKGDVVSEFGKKYDDPLHLGRPCYGYRTIADLMDRKGVSWKYYTGSVGTVDGTISAFDAIRQVRYGKDWGRNVSTPMTNIFSDIQNDTLPQVSFVTPPGPASDHAGFLTSGGPAWVTSIYVYLTEQKKLYGNTVIFVTWDDSGGWYDHVRPPSDAFGPLGFRVPLMVMAPYAKQAVSHKVHTFGSILHFIERNWNLGTLGQQDMTSDDLSDMFDYKQKPIPPIVNFGSFPASKIRQTYSQQYFERMLADPRPVDDDR